MSSANHGSSRRSLWWCVVVLLVFTVSKIPVLSLPFFWDELGVYGAAGLYMHDHTLSLLPASMPPELSRGHPLLFTFTHALGFHLFGDSVTGGHITALCITLILLASIFYIMRRLFSDAAAMTAVMLLIVQPIFYAQSVLILPEIMLALWMLWALYHWYAGNRALFAVFGSLAILTKETAIILPVVLLLSELVLRIGRHPNLPRVTWRSALAGIAPLAVFGIFLLIQRQQMGWYFFPYHQENIRITLPHLLDLSGDYLWFLFVEQGRVVLTVVVAIALLILIIGRRLRMHAFSVLLLFWCMGGVAFNGLSFYMNRYVLFVLIGGVLLASIVLHLLYQHNKKWLLLLPVITMCSAFYMYGDPFERVAPDESLESVFGYDENMQYIEYVRHMETAVDILLQDSDANTGVLVNFPVNTALRDVRYGYTRLHQGEDFVLTGSLQGNVPVQRALLANPGSYEIYIPEDSPLKKVQVIESEHAAFTLYRAE